MRCVTATATLPRSPMMRIRADSSQQTVALGYSKFCNLFTKNEWRGYQYRWDLYWYYSASFGYPLARAQGIGYAQELVSRLTHSELFCSASRYVSSQFQLDLRSLIRRPTRHSMTMSTSRFVILCELARL